MLLAEYACIYSMQCAIIVVLRLLSGDYESFPNHILNNTSNLERRNYQLVQSFMELGLLLLLYQDNVLECSKDNDLKYYSA